MSEDPHLVALSRRMDALESGLKAVRAGVSQVQARIDHEVPRMLATTYRATESLLAIHGRLSDRPTPPPLAGPFGGWAISADMARLIAELFEARRPRLTVELGSGTSSVLMGQLLAGREDARVISLEHDPVFYAQTLQMVDDAGVGDVVDVRYAPLESVTLSGEPYTWYSEAALDGLDGVDFVLVDGPPGHVGEQARYPAGPMLLDRCRDGAVFVVDDIVRDDEQAMIGRWLEELSMTRLADHTWHKKGASVLGIGRGEHPDGF